MNDDPVTEEGPRETAAALLQRLARGETAAMEAFYDLTSSHAFGFACRVLGDPSRAQEVLQEAYVDVWRRISRSRPCVGAELEWLLALVFDRCPEATDRFEAHRPAAHRRLT